MTSALRDNYSFTAVGHYRDAVVTFHFYRPKGTIVFDDGNELFVEGTLLEKLVGQDVGRVRETILEIVRHAVKYAVERYGPPANVTKH